VVRRVAISAVTAALSACQLIGGMGSRSSGGPCSTDSDCPADEHCSAENVCEPKDMGALAGAGGSGGKAVGGAPGTGGQGAAAGSGRGGGAGGVRPFAGAGSGNSAGSGNTAGSGQSGGSAGGRGGAANEGGKGGVGGDAGDGGTPNVCPEVSGVTATPSETTVGSAVALAATITNEDGIPGPATYAWQAEGGSLDGESAPEPSWSCTEPGEFTLTLAVSDTLCGDEASTTVTCVEAAAPAVVINEVESDGGTPADWIELYNAGSAPAELGGFIVRDNTDTGGYAIPAGTTLEPGDYLVLEEATLGLTFGSVDAARLYGPDAALLDSYNWTTHGTTSYGRCPNGSGALTATASPTKGGGNDCPAVGSDWPGADAVTTVDGSDVFAGNLSGLTYEGAAAGSPAVLWAARNRPGTLYRLLHDGSIWTSDTASGWNAGKAIHYADGSGNVDVEGITRAELDQPAMYAATERDNDALTVSRPSILRFDLTTSATSLSATHEWDLVADLPAVDANLGLEAITYVPDAFLVARSFVDESTGSVYDPADYPNHVGGLFFVGLQVNGAIYAYALDHTAVTFHRVATIASGHPTIMSLDFDRETGMLWAGCNDSCNGQVNVLVVDENSSSGTFGRFRVRFEFARPSSMPNLVNEGFALAPESECSGGQKPAFFADDAETDGHAIRRDTVPCGAL
jgi:hypothetical protein